MRFCTETHATLFVAIASFLVYLKTTCPTVPFTDGGELAAVGATLGIAHPTGYPLFTILARLAVMIPLGASAILKLNVMAALFTAMAAALSVNVFLLLPRAKGVGKVFMNDRWVEVCAATVGALALAFSTTFWSQSAEVEVYSLHLLLVMMILFAFLRGIEESRDGILSPFFFLFAFVVGLSFTNHMTTLLLAPPLLYLFVKRFGFGTNGSRVLLLLVPFFLLGLSLYLYLPIRSAAGTMYDWGHPATLERFIWHVTGKQYRVWMFSGWETTKKQLSHYVTNLPNEFNWGLLCLAALGAVESFQRGKRLFTFLLLTIIATLAYAVNYDIHDIDSYFLLSYIAFGWLISFGSLRALERVRKHVHALGLALIFSGVVAWQVLQNLHRADQSDNHLVEDFVRNSFACLEPNAMVFSGLWDYFVSASFYYQTVEKVRPDVVVVDKNLLQNRSWYFFQLKRSHPWLVEQSQAEVNAFLAELEKFERGRPLEFSVIQQRWNALLESLVEKSLATRPIYVDGWIEPEFPPKFKRVQAGLFFRLTLEEGDFSPKSMEYRFRTHGRTTPAIQDLRQYYVLMILSEAVTLWRQGRVEDAEKSISLASEIDPTNRAVHTFAAELRGRAHK